MLGDAVVAVRPALPAVSGVGLGPDDAPAVVALADAGVQDEDKASATAALAYNVAAALHVHHGVAWAVALAAGKRASTVAAAAAPCAQGPPQKRRRKPLPRGHAMDLGGAPPGGASTVGCGAALTLPRLLRLLGPSVAAPQSRAFVEVCWARPVVVHRRVPWLLCTTRDSSLPSIMGPWPVGGRTIAIPDSRSE